VNKALRPLLILGSASTLTIIIGVLTNKYYALYLGPEGLGMIGLFQSFLQLCTLFGGMGISVGIVRSVAGFVTSNNLMQIRAYKTAMWQLFGISAAVILVSSFVLQKIILKFLLPDQNIYALFSIIAASIISIASGIQIGFINAHHRTATLARITVLSQIAGSALGILIVWVWASAAIPFIMLTGPVVSLILANLYAPPLEKGVSLPEDVKSARTQLLKFGVPYLASSIVGTGVITMLPFIINNQLGQKDVGYYRAASLLSTGYLGALITALSQDYFPRVSAIRNDRDLLKKTVNQQLTLLIVCVTPLIIIMIIALPTFIQLIFTNSFMPVIKILRWQLIGDVFKLVSWVFAFSILAVAPTRFYLIIESVGGGLLLLLSTFGILTLGYSGIGIAYLITYFFYAITTVYIGFITIQISLSKINVILTSIAIIICFILSTLKYG
jgi:O-antigen/teichoic acid export membrane protein